MGINGKVAVVTGGGRGLGREIAHALAAAGAQIVVGSRDGAAPAGALAVACDVRDESALAALVATTLAQHGRLDVLVANSGVAGPTAPLWECAAADWRETIEVNLLGSFLSCRAVLPAMLAGGGGSIVVIGSMTGKRPLYGRTGYAASKAALVGLTRTLALEAAPHGVRVNLVSPGPVAGERIEGVIAAQAAARGLAPERVRAELAGPTGRFVTAAEVARAVVFLAGDDAAGITGADLNVSAGLVMY